MKRTQQPGFIPQYGGEGEYSLISHGRKINKQRMTSKEARRANMNRNKHNIESRWFWTGKS